MTPDQHVAHVRALKDIKGPISSQEAIAAKYELARREKRRTFWLRDIVAWVALVLSVVSIILSFYGTRP